MNTPDPKLEDAKLRAALQSARPSPPLLPQFQEQVWKRIEAAERAAAGSPSAGWLEALAACLMRPRFALAVGVVLIVVGAFWGARDGFRSSRHEAQARYVAAVAPNPLR